MKRITVIAVLLAAVAGFMSTSVYAASMAQTKLDCKEILERWANDPDSVAKHLVDECKGIKGLVAEDVPAVIPFAGDTVAAAADPCAGPDAAGSIHCWGPWAALAPAAGAAIGPPMLGPTDNFEQRPELASVYDTNGDIPQPPDPPLGSCPPGAPCGFATVVEGTTSEAPSDETGIARFSLAGDGTEFQVIQGGDSGDINSVTGMSTAFIDRPDEYENMQASGADGDTARSRLIARVIRTSDDEITTAADVWANRDDEGTTRSGFFAWGSAMSQADLDVLNNGSNISATFSGPMSVDNSTAATISVEFGARPVWSGAWTNPAYAFDAGGVLVGTDLISESGQFSSNVRAESYVQGVLLGQPENKSIAHVINVDLVDVGRVRDVGLLRE